MKQNFCIETRKREGKRVEKKREELREKMGRVRREERLIVRREELILGGSINRQFNIGCSKLFSNTSCKEKMKVPKNRRRLLLRPSTIPFSNSNQNVSDLVLQKVIPFPSGTNSLSLLSFPSHFFLVFSFKEDNWYYSLLSWHKKEGGFVATGSQDKVVLFRPSASSVDERNGGKVERGFNTKVERGFNMKVERHCLSERNKRRRGVLTTCVKWKSKSEEELLIGSKDGKVELVDCTTLKTLRCFQIHTKSVLGMDWNAQRKVLTCCGEDNTVSHSDLRQPLPIVAKTSACHYSKICSVEWNQNNQNNGTGDLLATGGNDDLAYLFDARVNLQLNFPLFRLYGHTGAVGNVSFSPLLPLLATGGGATDKTIRIWSTLNGECLNVLKTNSQVNDLLWDSSSNNLFSACSISNLIQVFSLSPPPTFSTFPPFSPLRFKSQLKTEFEFNRMLSLDISPNSNCLASLVNDGSLRFYGIQETTTPSPSSLSKQNSLENTRFEQMR